MTPRVVPPLGESRTKPLGFGFNAKTIEEFEAENRPWLEEAAQSAAKGLPVLDLVCAASLADKIPPRRPFLVPEIVPGGDVTLLSGHGGDGKSLLALMLMAAVSAGTAWLGIQVTHGGAIYFCAEDEQDEVHRRLFSICNAEGIDLASLDKLSILPLAGKAALLAVEGKNGTMEPTLLWNAFAAKVEQIRPVLLVIDGAVDGFGGNEISRAQVRQFISMLRGLAIKVCCAIVLLSHPSVSGMTNGSGISGSTAWHNSVRSRLYLSRPAAEADAIADPDARILKAMKANYGPLAAEMRLRWLEGRFVNESGAVPSKLDKATVEAKAEAVFLDLLQQFKMEGRSVSINPGHSYAPTVFAKHADSKGLSKNALKSAMDRLLKTKHVKVETTGPNSRRVSRLSFVAENEREK